MQRDIRTSIFKVGLFDPANNSGYSIDSFYHYSDELTEYPPEILERELNALQAEGCLRRIPPETRGLVKRSRHIQP